VRVLVLGGTAWLGRYTAAAVARGREVTCLARGRSGPVAVGAELVEADRERPGAYDTVRDAVWDTVIEVSWQPGFVRGALAALAGSARHWVCVSSTSVYADAAAVNADESAALLPAVVGDVADDGQYGEAKVACEVACRDRVADRLVVARAGVIGGPGDASDRCGYWVARSARAPREPMLVPTEQECPTQVIDVRDLAAWLVDAAENAVVGTFDAVGPQQPFSEWLATSRRVGGHTGVVAARSSRWLAEHGVGSFAGPESMALWISDPGMYGFAARNGAAAHVAGLRCRSLQATLADVLADERNRGLDRRPRQAGLLPDRERQLLTTVP